MEQQVTVCIGKQTSKYDTLMIICQASKRDKQRHDMCVICGIFEWFKSVNTPGNRSWNDVYFTIVTLTHTPDI